MMMFWWLLPLLGFVWLFSYGGANRFKSPENKTPMEILKERYAKGEIKKPEFEEKKKDLEADR